jgi:type III secretory pathway component EscS
MQQFKLRPDGFAEIKRQMLIRIIPIMLIAVTAGIVISSINSKDKTADKNVWPYVIRLIAISVEVSV